MRTRPRLLPMRWQGFSRHVPVAAIGMRPLELPTAITPDPYALDHHLLQVREAMQRIDFQLGSLLRQMVDRKLHQELGFANLGLYCRSRLGISSSKAWALIRLERKSWQTTPELRHAYRDGRITSTKAALLLPVISERHGQAWIQRATQVTCRRLGDEVTLTLDRMDEGAGGLFPPPDPHADVRGELARRRQDLRVQMRARMVQLFGENQPDKVREILARLPRKPWIGRRLTIEADIEVLRNVEETLDRAALPGEPRWHVFQRMLLHAIDVWSNVPRHRDPVFDRDQWRCAVPGCTARGSLHDHHILWRSRGGTNDQANRICVCVWHHAQALHGAWPRRITCLGLAPDDLRWGLGLRPDKPPLMKLRGDYYA